MQTLSKFLSEVKGFFRSHMSVMPCSKKSLLVVAGAAAAGTLVLSLAYLYYVKRCYTYLKHLGYDGPKPRFFVGNLMEFASSENSIPGETRPVISHYSKTLQRWTKRFGKIYGYYEGHLPVLVLADVDLVAEVFINNAQQLTKRRSFPMSMPSTHPDANIFLTNGARWARMRKILEKIMLNNRNTGVCLRYMDESLLNVFLNQEALKVSHANLDIYKLSKLLMVQTMFLVVFGIDIDTFVHNADISSNLKNYSSLRNLKEQLKLEDGSSLDDKLLFSHLVSCKFTDAFADYETFSLLKFCALMMPELECLWQGVASFKRFFNSYIFRLSYFADPMDWFHQVFIGKQLKDLRKMSNAASSSASTNSKTRKKSSLQLNEFSGRRFGYCESFFNTTANSKSSTAAPKKQQQQQDDEWQLTVREAISNTLLMFFAGYETTSSAIALCIQVLTIYPEQKDKLTQELKENWQELCFNHTKYGHLFKPGGYSSSGEGGDDETAECDHFDNTATQATNINQWNQFYDDIDKLRYLDMFVKEVLRMFPIANSMVSRECTLDNFSLGSYKVPKGMNIVVDVLSIHYDPVYWGPVSPELFYPERFLTERNPAAYLPFGAGSRKCLGMKLAMSQIKFFLVRLLQSYVIDKPKTNIGTTITTANADTPLFDQIQCKDILFASPLSVKVSMDVRKEFLKE